MTHYIQESYGLTSKKLVQQFCMKNNADCIAQLKRGYIKGDKMKHISPKFIHTREFHKNGHIDVQQIHSSNKVDDLLTKLPTSTFKKLVQ